jgi:hypothetical protein
MMAVEQVHMREDQGDAPRAAVTRYNPSLLTATVQYNRQETPRGDDKPRLVTRAGFVGGIAVMLAVIAIIWKPWDRPSVVTGLEPARIEFIAQTAGVSATAGGSGEPHIAPDTIGFGNQEAGTMSLPGRQRRHSPSRPSGRMPALARSAPGLLRPASPPRSARHTEAPRSRIR